MTDERLRELAEAVRAARAAWEAAGSLAEERVTGDALERASNALRLAMDEDAVISLLDRCSLPVVRTCGDCGWHGATGVGMVYACCHTDHGEDDSLPPVDLDAAPPTWCPLRERAGKGER